MGKKTTTVVQWTCDRCKVSAEGAMPNSPRDAWAYVKLDQDAGWDHAHPWWSPRMLRPVLLCGACTEGLVTYLNGKEAAND